MSDGDAKPVDTAKLKAAHAVTIEDNLATWMRQMAVWSSIGLAFFAFFFGTRDDMSQFHRGELVAMFAVPVLLLLIGIVTGVQAVDSYIRRARTFDVPVTVSYVITSTIWILILIAFVLGAAVKFAKLYRSRLRRL